MRFIIIPVLSLIISAYTCKKDESGSVTVNLKVNNCEKYTAVSGSREICFDSVVMDNRCPPGVNCIIAGEGICRFQVKRGDDDVRTVTLTTLPHGSAGIIYPREADVFDLHIKLDDLSQSRGSYNNYTATLTVTKQQ